MGVLHLLSIIYLNFFFFDFLFICCHEIAVKKLLFSLELNFFGDSALVEIIDCFFEIFRHFFWDCSAVICVSAQVKVLNLILPFLLFVLSNKNLMFLLFTPLFFNRIKFTLLLILYPFSSQLLVHLLQAHQLLRMIPPAHLGI